MNIADWLDILRTISISAASAAAIYGIENWRRELKGKKKYECAEETLALFYKAKDLLSAIRSPFGTADEGKSRTPSENEDPDKKLALDKAYVLWERYQKHSDTFNQLFASRYKFLALFGKRADEPFDILKDIISQLYSSVIMMGAILTDQAQGKISVNDADKWKEEYMRLSSIYWQGFGGSDPLLPRIDQMISSIEAICGPVLQGNKYKTSKS